MKNKPIIRYGEIHRNVLPQGWGYRGTVILLCIQIVIRQF